MTHGYYGTRTYRVWANMKTRCQNTNSTSYPYYGAKGITVCSRWQSFENFLADMGEAPEGRTLDRVDGSKGYSLENCRWATLQQQSWNRKAHLGNTSGVKGVRKERGRWRAQGAVEGKNQHLYFGEDFFEAVCARKAWERDNDPDFICL